MGIYILNLILIIAFTIIFNENKVKKFRKYLVVIISFQLIMISTLKSRLVGTDMGNYLDYFKKASQVSTKELLSLRFESGYALLNKILSRYIVNEQLFFFSIALIVIILISITIYKYSNNLLISYYLFCTTDLFYFTLSGFRQAIAMSILFFSYRYIVEKNFWRFLLCISLAMLFHKTAIIFVIAYPVSKININFENIIKYIVIVIMINLVKRPLIIFITKNFFGEYEMMLKQSNTYTFALIILIIIFCGLLFGRNMIKVDRESKILYNMMFLAFIMQTLATEANNMVRITSYFYIFVILFIPKILKGINDKNMKIFGGYCILIISFFQLIYLIPNSLLGVYPYKFFWESLFK